MDTEEILLKLEDKKKRPLMVFRSNGLVSFYRYSEMEEKDKENIIEVFATLKEKGVLLDESEELTAESIMAYLNYETDEDFCG